MHTQDWDAVVDAAVAAIRPYLASLPTRDVGADAAPDVVRKAVTVELTDDGEPAADVVADLAARTEPWVTAHASGRFFGFVIGGLPTAGRVSRFPRHVPQSAHSTGARGGGGARAGGALTSS